MAAARHWAQTHLVVNGLTMLGSSIWQRGWLALALVTCLVVPRSALAQTTIHATGAGTLSYSDNVFGAPSHPPSGVQGPIQAWTLTLTPGLELYSDYERSRYFASYGHPFTFYLHHPKANTDGDIGLLRGIWTLSAYDELLLSAAVSRTTNSLAQLQSPTPAGEALVDGQTTTLRLEGSEQFSHRFDEHWSLRQSAGAASVRPIKATRPEPRRRNFDWGTGLDYTSERDRWGVYASGSYFRQGPVRESGVRESPSRQAVVDSYLFYRRDLSEHWVGEGRVGAVGAYDLKGHSLYRPRWGSTIGWSQEGLGATLSYDRSVAVSLLTGLTLYSDTLRLTGAAPLWPAAHLAMFISEGAARSRVVDEQQRAAPQVAWTWTSEAGLSCTPPGGYLEITLTGMHLEQHSPARYSSALPDFTRNIVSLTVSGRFPSREIASIPDAPPLRVDAADRSTIGPQSETEELPQQDDWATQADSE